MKESDVNHYLITENANDLIILTNEKCKAEYVNERALKHLLGYSKEEIIGVSGLKFIHPDDIQNTLLSVKKGIEESQGVAEIRFRHKNGHYVWMEATGKTFIDDIGWLKAIIILRDITQGILLKQKLKESEEKYRIAYDQAEFYKNLCAHDFSNILLVISGSYQLCSLFLEDPKKAKEVKANLERIRDQVKRANILIKNVQTLSELDNNKPLLKLIDICTSLTESIKYIYESYKEKSIEINVNSSNDQFFVSANDLIRDVFENILINAIKYNNKPIMEISIKISKIEKNNKNHVKLEFNDNGIGIQDSRKELIFQEGHKRDKYTKGMGFGLTLVKKIIDSYNGEIWVEDRVPNDHTQGCNFVVLIPTR